MKDDLKSLAKRLDTLEKSLKLADLDKRMKFAEDRIRVLADSLTSSKDVEKMLDVYYKRMSNDPNISNKVLMREVELSNKARESRDKEMDREWEKENQRIDKETRRIQKDLERLNRETVSEARLKAIEMRLGIVEAIANSALRK
ncbi:MAG: hypothetical protein CML66_27145 [Rhodobacteraceae bacterium]|nr:hypothetical protein [Paracoccaceae bacterium]MAY47050.1 hypothetical protein [Paracoccaceae bacterium]|tara:strand:+ start:114 stop:545 length:432 start_codon:yes stop_codon:yes gene_type:complete